MKKLDKLILQSFIGPFILTFFVVVFILLTQYMLKYFEEFVGKDLGFYVFAELIMYFSINMTPVALPLAVLLSSLMTFGNLGEHFELTAIKSAGISLIRILMPLFVFVCGLSVLAFFSNNFIVPKANLNAYSLLYDIKQTKPSLDIKEGTFYTGIPDYSIKVDRKYPDGETLGNLIIYDHSARMGNTNVILADSGRMSTFNNNNYLMLELFNGNSYQESETRTSKYNEVDDFYRSSFDESKLVFSLASFGLKETKKELFASNRMMKHAAQLNHDIDSMNNNMKKLRYDMYFFVDRHFSYHLHGDIQAPEELIPVYDSLEERRYRRYMMDTDIQPEERQRLNNTAKRTSYQANRENTEGKTPTPKPGTIKNRDGIKKKIQTDSIQTARRFLAVAVDTIKKEDNKLYTQHKLDPALFLTFLKPIPTMQDSFQGPRIFKPEIDSVTLSLEKASAEQTHWEKYDSIYQVPTNKSKVLEKALEQARFVKNKMNMQETQMKSLRKETNTYIIEKNKKYSQAVACIIMFLIGAPLGAIIKKGGLGVPVIISVCFFIIFYVLSMTGEKWGKEALIDPILASWAANIFLFPFGIFFLIQARNDVRVFESDFYKVAFDKIKNRLTKFLPV